MLLVIVGLSTVTTSMFVFVERNMRRNHKFPWYLKIFAFDFKKTTIVPTKHHSSNTTFNRHYLNIVNNKKRKFIDSVKRFLFFN